MFKKYSEFKITSIITCAVLIFFTVSYFRFLPLNLFNINYHNLDNAFNVYYFFLTELIAILLSVIFVLSYALKSDKELKERYKSIAYGLLALLFFFVAYYGEALVFKILGIDFNTLKTSTKIFCLIIYSLLTESIMILIYFKKIKEDWKDFIKNNHTFFKENVKYWLYGVAAMMISNLIINFIITDGIAANEQAIRDIMKISPLYIFFSAVLYSPVVEELTFRLSIQKIFSNKWLFIIISGLLFGGMHVFGDFKNLTDLLYIIPYSTPGICFAYMLQKSNNIFVPISFHLIHNGILVSLQLLIQFLG